MSKSVVVVVFFPAHFIGSLGSWCCWKIVTQNSNANVLKLRKLITLVGRDIFNEFIKIFSKSNSRESLYRSNTYGKKTNMQNKKKQQQVSSVICMCVLCVVVYVGVVIGVVFISVQYNWVSCWFLHAVFHWTTKKAWKACYVIYSCWLLLCLNVISLHVFLVS